MDQQIEKVSPAMVVVVHPPSIARKDTKGGSEAATTRRLFASCKAGGGRADKERKVIS